MKYFTLLSAVLTAWFSLVFEAGASTSSILIDAQSGKVLYSENADVRRFPASLTKLMTLYIAFNALENGSLKLDDRLKVSHTAANRSPSRLGLKAGQTIDVKTAVLATIIKSANDCATVLGESLAKDERSFAKLMTETAQKLGMKDTTFKNASGLPHSEQKTTARDMAVLAAAMYRHFPQYYAWFSLKEFSYDGQTFQTHNNLLKDFEGADGMKTGYTAASGFNIVTSAKRGSHRVIAVTMGHDDLQSRDQTAAVMMDQALSKMANADIVNVQKLTKDIRLTLAPVSKKQTAAKSLAHASGRHGAGRAKKQVAQNMSAPSGRDFAIQVGAFRSEAKALSHAQSIKNKLSGQFYFRKVQTEKFALNGVPMFRAKLVGASEENALKACRFLKSKNQSCMAAPYRSNVSYAQKQI